MAATIAICTGEDNSRTKRVTRLGSRASHVEANTWRTFASVSTFADGSGVFTLKRDGEIIHGFAWDAEAPKA